MPWGCASAGPLSIRVHWWRTPIAQRERAELSTHLPLFLKGPRSKNVGVCLVLLVGPHIFSPLTSGHGETNHGEWKTRPLQGQLPPKIFTSNLAFSPVRGMRLTTGRAGRVLLPCLLLIETKTLPGLLGLLLTWAFLLSWWFFRFSISSLPLLLRAF